MGLTVDHKGEGYKWFYSLSGWYLGLMIELVLKHDVLEYQSCHPINGLFGSMGPNFWLASFLTKGNILIHLGWHLILGSFSYLYPIIENFVYNNSVNSILFKFFAEFPDKKRENNSFLKFIKFLITPYNVDMRPKGPILGTYIIENFM